MSATTIAVATMTETVDPPPGSRPGHAELPAPDAVRSVYALRVAPAIFSSCRPSHGTYARRPPVRNSPNELWLRTDHEPSESLERDDAYDDDYGGRGERGVGRHVYHGLYLNSGVSAKLHLTNWARELRQRLVPVVWCGPVYTAHRLFPAPRYARPHRLVVIQVRLERSAELHRL